MKNLILHILAYVPYLNRLIFMDNDAIVSRMCDEGAVDYIKSLRPQDRRMLFFTMGTDIRNEYLLWHPMNPYTTKMLNRMKSEQKSGSRWHPDYYSWSIIRRLIVAASMDVTPVSNDIDASESLIYSLMTTPDDAVETLTAITEAVKVLVENQRWDLLDEVYAEIILFGPSPLKMKTLLDATGDNVTKITPVNYLRAAKSSISDDFREH